MCQENSAWKIKVSTWCRPELDPRHWSIFSGHAGKNCADARNLCSPQGRVPLESALRVPWPATKAYGHCLITDFRFIPLNDMERDSQVTVEIYMNRFVCTRSKLGLLFETDLSNRNAIVPANDRAL
jgi:hypothetical protein